MAGGDEGKCGLQGKESNSTDLGLGVNYGGIPQNLVFNSILLSILLIGFFILRRSALKLLNKVVKKDDVSKWTTLFFVHTSEVATSAFSGVVEGARGVTDKVKRTVAERGESGNGSSGSGSLRSSGRSKRGEGDGPAEAESGQAGVVTQSPKKSSPSPASPTSDGDATDPGGGGDGSAPPGEEEEGVSPAAAVKDEVAVRDRDDDGQAAEAANSSPPPRISTRPQLQRQHTLQNSLTTMEWLSSIFTMPDKEIRRLCGDDALQYLRYQRYIMVYLAFVVVLSIGVILPLNFQGNLQGEKTSFEHTTLVNLEPNSDFLWAHVILSFVYFPLAILSMRHFSRGVKFQDVDLDLRKTLLIEEIPRYLCKKGELKEYFAKAFDGRMKIRTIHFAYDVEDLMEVDEELRKTTIAREYLELREAAGKKPFTLQPVACSRCSRCFCCCCGPDAMDAMRYYSEQEEELKEEFEQERREALSKPLGIAFVTFHTINMAKEVYESFQKRSFTDCGFKPPAAEEFPQLKVEDWKLRFAPTPDDLYWEHLNLDSRWLLFKSILVNTALFFVIFFLTTPEYLISQTDWLVSALGTDVLHLSPVVVDFLPTLMLWGFTALLPLLVAWSDRFLGHWTRSAENHNIMKKTFWFLMLVVVILPTFGFTTADAFVKLILDGGQDYRWECVFLPDSGAFFVNYIITAALAGAGLELIRFPELIIYTIKICMSKSKADVPAIRDAIKYEFRFGEQYARLALIFCMTMMYCLSCPLITPFGLLFFVTKHYVDRHNLLYAYKPSKINQAVHETAIGFVILGVVIMQFFMFMFLYLRGGEAASLTLQAKVMLAVFLISVNMFSAQLWANTCKKLSPIEYVEVTYIREDVDQSEYVYLPPVLLDSFKKEDGDSASLGSRGQGQGQGHSSDHQQEQEALAEYGTFREQNETQ